MAKLSAWNVSCRLFFQSFFSSITWLLTMSILKSGWCRERCKTGLKGRRGWPPSHRTPRGNEALVKLCGEEVKRGFVSLSSLSQPGYRFHQTKEFGASILPKYIHFRSTRKCELTTAPTRTTSPLLSPLNPIQPRPLDHFPATAPFWVGSFLAAAAAAAAAGDPLPPPAAAFLAPPRSRSTSLRASSSWSFRSSMRKAS